MRANHAGTSSVLVVGSGITGLMSAHQMASAGHRVTVLSKSPDPRTAPADARFDSSTWDGYINRYITLTEGHPYLDLPGYISVMYPHIGQDFRVDVTEGGMLALPSEQFDALTQRFLAQRVRANEDPEATLRLFHEYVDENRASMEMWYELLTGAVRAQPGLAAKVALHSDGIDRFYDEASLYEGALAAQGQEGIVKQCHVPDELAARDDFAIYRRGLGADGFIRGGGLTMYGLAFNVQALAREWLLRDLEAMGVTLLFGEAHEVVAMERGTEGAVSGLRTRAGRVHGAKHVLMHGGAYMDPELLRDTEAHGRLAGVKGLWVRIRNAHALFDVPMPRPNKIHGGKYAVKMDGHTYRGQIADLNVMPQRGADGSWDLIVGSGYLFVGVYPFLGNDALGKAEQLAMRAFLQVVARVYHLPIDIEAVLGGTDPHIDVPARGCVRSWTPDDRELRTIMPTVDGGVLMIDGGGNTGSTTKAPFVSRAARDFIQAIDARTTVHEQVALVAAYEATRAALRKTRSDLRAERWRELEEQLRGARAEARDG